MKNVRKNKYSNQLKRTIKKVDRRPMKKTISTPKRTYKTQKTKWKQIQDFYPLLQHPEKYVGSSKLISLRSSYEISYAIRLDNSDDVIEWSSEDIIVWYQYPLNENHKYFTDFYVKLKNGKEYVIEVKPIHQTIEPIKTLKTSEASYNKACYEFGKNKAKWNAAKEYCKQERDKGRKLYFRVLTETDLIKEEIILK